MILEPRNPGEPTVETSGVLDLGRERDLRAARARITELEEKLAVHAGKLRGSVELRDRWAEKHNVGTCGFHPHVIVSDETPRVECADCGEELAALDVLRQFANGERQFVSRLNSLHDEMRTLAVEVDKLKRQRSNLGSQVKRRGELPKLRDGLREACDLLLEVLEDQPTRPAFIRATALRKLVEGR